MSTAVAHSFNKLLNQPKSATKSKANRDADDCVKRLRRMILVEGIPSAAVCLKSSVCQIGPEAVVGSRSSAPDMENTAQSE